MGKQYLNGVLYSGVVNHIGVDEPQIYHANWIATSVTTSGTPVTQEITVPSGKYFVILYLPLSWNGSALNTTPNVFGLKINGSNNTKTLATVSNSYGRFAVYVDLAEESTIVAITQMQQSVTWDSNYLDRGGMDVIQIQPHYNLHKYSTEEQVIGTWIDGKPLYEKTVQLTLTPGSNTTAIAHGISGISRVVDYNGILFGSLYGLDKTCKMSQSVFNSATSTGMTANTTYCANIQYVDATNVMYSLGSAYPANIQMNLTVQYTKTTD